MTNDPPRAGPVEAPGTSTDAATQTDRPADGSRTSQGVFARSASDQVVAGVAGGLGARLGVDPMFVRLAFVALAAAGGFGVVTYVVLWGLSPMTTTTARPRPATTQQAVALGFVLVGTLLLLRDLGLWFGDGVTWPVVAAALASAVLWTSGDDRTRAGLDDVVGHLRGATTGGPGRDALGGLEESLADIPRLRLLLGGGLLLAGLAGMFASSRSVSALLDVGLAMAVAVIGVGLVLGPWLARLTGQLTEERRERIRADERTRMAAHLHDSVLQTLALIQRNAQDPARTVALARRQERELRAWLYADPERPPGASPAGDRDRTLRQALDTVVEEIEDTHLVSVDVVVVGDVPMTAPADALVGAVREAAVNAAKHAQVSEVRVFVEVEDDALVASVLDRGVGFDPAAVDDDRRGIAESIRGRISRAGGEVTLHTGVGEGTEVELRVPVRRAAQTTTVDEPGADG